MIGPAELGELINTRFTHTAFRLETLPAYEVATDRVEGAQLSDFDRWLAGEDEPSWDRKRPWLDTLATERESLRYRYRVRIIGQADGTLTDYERYSCEWGYALNATAGEGIFILDRAEHPVPPPVLDYDGWLLDDEVPVRMHYGVDGSFVGASLEPERLADYRQSRDVAMSLASPFSAWWARHPEHRRTRTARAA